MKDLLKGLTLEEINKIDLTDYINSFIGGTSIEHDEILIYMRERAGMEHYKLLYWLCNQVNNSDIFDIGTHLGSSAAILAANKSNIIYTFDITKKGSMPMLQNILYYLQDLTNPEVRKIWESKLLNSPIIFIDIDPHEGAREYDLYIWLKSKKYKGMLFCDDICLFESMRTHFWNKIPDVEKLDLTHLGHITGTGVVFFD